MAEEANQVEEASQVVEEDVLEADGEKWTPAYSNKKQ